jgi:radical SAM superfamily enzyme YgiQ (UPF0313 family)
MSREMSRLTDTISRRLASEIGVIRKEHGGRLRVCLVYPNSYFVGMSSLGFQAVYHLFNARQDVVCERAFVPDPDDLVDLARTEGALVSYESQMPLQQFDAIAFSVSYELDYINIARVLRLARIPIMARERDQHHPLVIAGGAAVSINPEPLAEIVDAFVIGEVEPMCERLLDVLASRAGRSEAMARAAGIPGVYCSAASAPGGPFDGGRRHAPALRASPTVHEAGSPQRGSPTVERQYARSLADSPTHSRVLTPETEFGELFLVEISRGCGRGCKFCVTPACYWPFRWRPMESVLEAVRLGLQHRDAIGLISAAVTDHPNIDEIAGRIVELGARLSVSSLRADGVSPALMEALARSGARSVTFAPEAGTDRLRAAIGKGITEDHIIGALRMAFAAGIKEAKLYFMVGLPGEGEEDIAAIPELVRTCLRRADLRRVTVAAGGFVPKPYTPYEREAMLPVAEVSRRLRAIRDALRGERRVTVAVESANWSHIEGALSRGDRRLGAAIAAAEAGGGNLAAWRQAFRECGLTADEFTSARGPNDALPWSFLNPRGRPR